MNPGHKRVRALLHYGKCALRVWVLISISSGGDAAHPQQLEVKDLKGQNPWWWQLSSTFHHAAAKANMLLSSAFVFAHIQRQRKEFTLKVEGEAASLQAAFLLKARKSQKKLSVTQTAAGGTSATTCNGHQPILPQRGWEDEPPPQKSPCPQTCCSGGGTWSARTYRRGQCCHC